MYRNVFFSFLMMAVLLSSCSKTKPEPQVPTDPIPETEFTLQFKPSGLNNLTEALGDLEFIISLRNAQDDPVLVNQKLAAIDSGGVYSARIRVPKGSYKLEKFLLARKTGLVRFATPLAGFPKAQQVNNPLSIDFTQTNSGLKLVEVELLPVNSNDKESMYGYPDGTFQLPSDPNDPPPGTRKIRIRPVFKIGNVVYDSISAYLQVYSWDAQNNQSLMPISVPAGISELNLATDAVRYEFRMLKWGKTALLPLNAADLSASTVYTIMAEAEPRRLKFVYGNRWTNNNWFAESKTEYQYSAQGIVQKVLHFRKHADNSPYLALTEEAEYAGERIGRIVRKNEQSQQIGNSTFTYGTNGLPSLVRIQQGDSITHIRLQYITSLDNYQQLRVDQVGAEFESNFTSLLHHYQAEYDKGRMLSTRYASNNGNLQEGLYQYDNAINPFQFTGWPDEKLFIHSIHNRNAQTLTYQNAYSQSEIYQFAYTYDSEGYPTELRTWHRNPVTGQHLFEYKEGFVYE
jgi:hypothetical protein